ncbi:unnamed protein product (plasmid) [Klebsiella pneumoniae]|nr:unnamed protein product [Klebsiella pneumoniae]
MVRIIYTLKYLRDPQLERNIRRSQNRIESYHQLRAAVVKVGGKKELTGKKFLLAREPVCRSQLKPLRFSGSSKEEGKPLATVLLLERYESGSSTGAGRSSHVKSVRYQDAPSAVALLQQ